MGKIISLIKIYIENKISVWTILALSLVLHITLAADANNVLFANELFAQLLKEEFLYFINYFISSSIAITSAFLFIVWGLYLLAKRDGAAREYRLKDTLPYLKNLLWSLVSIKYFFSVIAHYWLGENWNRFFLQGFSDLSVKILITSTSLYFFVQIIKYIKRKTS